MTDQPDIASIVEAALKRVQQGQINQAQFAKYVEATEARYERELQSLGRLLMNVREENLRLEDELEEQRKRYSELTALFREAGWVLSDEYVSEDDW